MVALLFYAITVAAPDRAAEIAPGFAAQMQAREAPVTASIAASIFGFIPLAHASEDAKSSASLTESVSIAAAIVDDSRRSGVDYRFRRG